MLHTKVMTTISVRILLRTRVFLSLVPTFVAMPHLVLLTMIFRVSHSYQNVLVRIFFFGSMCERAAPLAIACLWCLAHPCGSVAIHVFMSQFVGEYVDGILVDRLFFWALPTVFVFVCCVCGCISVCLFVYMCTCVSVSVHVCVCVCVCVCV